MSKRIKTFTVSNPFGMKPFTVCAYHRAQIEESRAILCARFEECEGTCRECRFGPFPSQAIVLRNMLRDENYSHVTVRPEMPRTYIVYFRDPTSPTGVCALGSVGISPETTAVLGGRSVNFGASRGRIAESRR